MRLYHLLIRRVVTQLAYNSNALSDNMTDATLLVLELLQRKDADINSNFWMFDVILARDIQPVYLYDGVDDSDIDTLRKSTASYEPDLSLFKGNKA